MSASRGEGVVQEALTPEQRARVVIDRQLATSGWLVCDRVDLDVVNHAGVAVREVHLGEAGRADYLLYVGRRLCGVIEAKPAGTPLTGVQWQTARYAEGVPDASASGRFGVSRGARRTCGTGCLTSRVA